MKGDTPNSRRLIGEEAIRLKRKSMDNLYTTVTSKTEIYNKLVATKKDAFVDILVI